MPAFSWYLPRAHCLHSLTPVTLLALPTVQRMQASGLAWPEEGRNLPMGQCLHFDCKEFTGPNLPEGQKFDMLVPVKTFVLEETLEVFHFDKSLRNNGVSLKAI